MVNSWVKLLSSPLPTLWGVAISTGSIWYIMEEKWAAILALIFGGVALCHSIVVLSKKLISKWKVWRREKIIIDRVSKLSKREKEILRQALEEDSRSFYGSIEDKTIASMIGWDILMPGGSNVVNVVHHPLMINGVVWDYIRSNPEVLD